MVANGVGLNMWERFWHQEQPESADTLELLWRGRLIAKFATRFLNRSDCYYVQNVDEDGRAHYSKKKQGDADFKPISRAIRDHLHGIHTLSLPALSETGTCKWCCWDSDDDSGELLKLAEGLRQRGLHPHRESVREGRDGHLWIFFSRPVSAHDLLDFNSQLVKELGVDCSAIEFFPKSATAESQIRLPLGFHRKGGYNKRGYFYGVPEGESYWLDGQMVHIAEIVPDDPTTIEQTAILLRQIKAQQAREFRRANKASTNATESEKKAEEKVRPPILEHVTLTQKKDARDYILACPSCAQRGEDKHQDNLRISKTDPRLFNCVSRGPGNGCTTDEIWFALGDPWHVATKAGATA
ncbi:MAG TPA: hypothetical protein V6C86_05745 [Oculatellaceae cyanobacterium]